MKSQLLIKVYEAYLNILWTDYKKYEHPAFLIISFMIKKISDELIGQAIVTFEAMTIKPSATTPT